MKITSRPQTQRASSSAPAGAVARATHAGAAGGASPVQSVAPTTSIMGVPADKVTPKVRVAIETLMREVERLRVDVEELKRRNGELEKLTDEDAMLPVVNRRAFVRELSRTM
ncbi:MAG: GGDEF domain-containing protein, partial [Alphaproteobacteria bacterium]